MTASGPVLTKEHKGRLLNPPRSLKKSASDILVYGSAAQEVYRDPDRSVEYARIKVESGLCYMSVVYRLLRYLPPDTAFIPPLIHSSFRGVFRDLLLAVITTGKKRVLSKQHLWTRATRAAIQHRMRGMRLTQSIGRPLRDLLSKFKSYTMGKLMNLADIYLTLLLYEVEMHDSVKQALKHLLEFAREMIRTSRTGSREKALSDVHDAMQHLLQYAELAQQELSTALLKPNLHFLLCHVERLCMRLGHISQFLELFVERNVNYAKQLAKFRATNEPEPVLSNDLLLLMAASVLEKHAQLSEEQLEKYENTNHEAGNRTAGSCMIGTSCLLEDVPDVHAAYETALTRFLRSFSTWLQQHGITEEDMLVGDSEHHVYSRAQTSQGEAIGSSTYKRATQRDSSMLAYTRKRTGKKSVGKAISYVQVISGHGTVVNMALLRRLPHTRTVDHEVWGRLYSSAADHDQCTDYILVLLDEISGPCCYTCLDMETYIYREASYMRGTPLS